MGHCYGRRISPILSLLFHPRAPCRHNKAHIPALNCQTHSHATVLIAPKLGRPGPRPRYGGCRTLSPDLMEPSDFRDISGMANVSVKGHAASILHYHQIKGRKIPFPLNTQGFLYYHHTPNTPPTSAEIRFRVTAAHDRFNFAGGSDLLGPGHRRWSLSLFQLAGCKKHSGLWDLAREEGLVDNATEKWVTQNASLNSVNFGQVLHYLGQPFVMDMQSTEVTLSIVTPHAFGHVRLGGLMMVKRSGKPSNPYHGYILLRFERSSRPEHRNSRTIVLRILKILQPVVMEDPDYDMYLPIAKEGELLQRPKTGHATGSVIYTIDLDAEAKRHRDLNLLVE